MISSSTSQDLGTKRMETFLCFDSFGTKSKLVFSSGEGILAHFSFFPKTISFLVLHLQTLNMDLDPAQNDYPPSPPFNRQNWGFGHFMTNNAKHRPEGTSTHHLTIHWMLVMTPLL
jgi:hypothetical protein